VGGGQSQMSKSSRVGVEASQSRVAARYCSIEIEVGVKAAIGD
jgi:hypothetical protein